MFGGLGGGVIDLGNPVSNDPLNDGLVGWWMGLPNMYGGNVLPNLINRSSDGTLNSFASPMTPTSGWVTSPNGFGALTLDGSNDYVSFPNIASQFGNDGTAHFLVKRDVATPGSDGVSGFVAMGGESQTTHYPYTNGLMYSSILITGRYNAITLSSTVDRATWHTLTVTQKPGSNGYVIYQNGQQIYSDTGASSVSLTSTPYLGKDTIFGVVFGGQFGAFQLYNRSLSADEVLRLHMESMSNFPRLIRRIPTRTWFGVAAAAAIFTGTAALVTGKATLSSSATFSPGTHTATASLTSSHVTLAAASTFSPGTHTASAALVSGGMVLTASSTFSPGTHSATSTLTTGHVTLAASSTFSAGTHTSTVSVSMGPAVLASSTTFSPGVHIATAALTSSKATLSASSQFIQAVFTASAAITVGRATLAAMMNVLNPSYTATAALTAPHTTLAATAIFSAAVYLAHAALSVRGATLASVATFTPPVYQATSILVTGHASLSASGTVQGPPTATAALTVGHTTITASSTVVNVTYHGSAVLVIGGVTLTASTLFVTISGPYRIDMSYLYVPGIMTQSIMTSGIKASQII